MTEPRRTQLLILAAVLSITLCGAVIGTQSVDQKQVDGLIKVDMGDVFERGNTKIEEAELAKLPSLPPGFVSLTGKAYRVTTTAVASGPYDAIFRVNSVTDEQAFKNLRVLHVEPDEFDPDGEVWVDRTAASDHHEPAHDFRQKTIIGHSPELDTGVYMVARVVPKVEANADLEVTAEGEPESVQLPLDATFVLTIKNKGPDVATHVGALMNYSSVGGDLMSVTESQGTCKGIGLGVYCKLGQLAAGASATVKITMAPRDDFGGTYETAVRVAANENDRKPENNETVGTVLVLKDPNIPPEVALHGLGGDLFEQGATVLLQATASDPDGSITKVEFFDNYQSIGIGTSTDARHFSLRTSPLSNGRHDFQAVATDNGGRSTTIDVLSIFVNGPIQVRIVEPKAETLVAPGSDLTLVAEATHPSGSIKTLEFFHTHNTSLGVATATQDNHFTLELRNARRTTYNIEARATDESGVVSKSAPLTFTVSTRPKVKILTPAEGASLVAPANIEISFNFEVFDSHFSTVEIYANGELINSGRASSPGKQHTFNWAGVKPGKYVLKAVVLDDIQTRGESEVNIIVNERNGNKQ